MLFFNNKKILDPVGNHSPGRRGGFPFSAGTDPGALEHRNSRRICGKMGGFSLPGSSGRNLACEPDPWGKTVVPG